MDYNIIGFAGRLASGKTELATICEKYGYEKLYFALPLKLLCASLLDTTIEELNVLKRNNNNIDIKVPNDWVTIISEETNISYDDVFNVIGNKTIHTVRDLLQIVGTDIIRKYNKDWHVQRIKEMIKPNIKYVIDDVRFPNEKQMIEELNGVCWFVIRPIINNVSNHLSETSLKWQDFENIIVNDSTLSYLQYHWEMFMENGHDKSLEMRNNLKNKMLNDNSNLYDKKDYFTIMDAYFLHPDELSYTSQFFNNTNIKNVFMENENVVVYENDKKEIVNNCYCIEDLKIYL